MPTLLEVLLWFDLKYSVLHSQIMGLLIGKIIFKIGFNIPRNYLVQPYKFYLFIIVV